MFASLTALEILQKCWPKTEKKNRFIVGSCFILKTQKIPFFSILKNFIPLQFFSRLSIVHQVNSLNKLKKRLFNKFITYRCYIEFFSLFISFPLRQSSHYESSEFSQPNNFDHFQSLDGTTCINAPKFSKTSKIQQYQTILLCK